MQTAEQVFDTPVQSLDPKEQLRLAGLILRALADLPEMAGFSDSWSDEDIEDVNRFSMEYMAKRLAEEEGEAGG